MSFIRCFDEKQIAALYNDKNIKLFNLLKKDILSGIIFPAVRKNQIYFYYEGGCLYRFSNGAFTRDGAYKNYNHGIAGLSDYEAAKKQNENKYTNAEGNNKERRLLNTLYCHTFGKEHRYDTVVLDIEVNLNGKIGGGKKCDLVLYNVPLGEIMFVECKVFSDRRVNVKCGFVPEVISQVNIYTEAIAEQEQSIIEQYKNHIEIVNKLFGTEYPSPTKIVRPAKLLVYETPLKLTENNSYSINTINSAIKNNNVVWFKQNERPSTDEIWNSLCK